MINATVSLLFAFLTRRLALVSSWPSATHALATAGLLRQLVDGWFAGTGSVELQGLHTSPERERSQLEWMLDRDPAELLSPTLGEPPPLLASWEAAFDALVSNNDGTDDDDHEARQRQVDREDLARLRAHHSAMVKHVRWCIDQFGDAELRRSESFTFDREKVNAFVDRLAAYIARNEGDEEEHELTDQEVFEEHQRKLDRKELVALREAAKTYLDAMYDSPHTGEAAKAHDDLRRLVGK